MTKYLNEKEAYENLANAVVMQAVKDYRKTLLQLKKYPKNNELVIKQKGIMTFFQSQWFNSLTNLKFEKIIEQLNAEVH